MKLAEIANALVEGCRNGTEAQGLETLYAKDAVSVEPFDYSGQGRRVKGIDAIKGKHDWWASVATMHSSTVDGPYLHGENRFAVIFGMDVTMNDSGQRMQMKEVAVYVVEDGKITKEMFFSPPMG